MTTRAKFNRLAGAWLMTVGALLCGGAGEVRAQDTPKEKLPSAEEIIERSIEAQGGRAVFDKIRTRISKATTDVTPPGVKGTLASYAEAPAKLYQMLELEGMGKTEAGSDGKVCWNISTMMGPRILEGEERANMEREATFNMLLHWRKLYKSVECAGTEEVDGRPCFKVIMTPNEGKPETYFFERKRGLPIRVETVLTTAMGDARIVTAIEDYRPVKVNDDDKVILPHKIIQEVAGMQKFTMAVTSYEQNIDIPAERFELPEPIKQLVEKSKREKSEGE